MSKLLLESGANINFKDQNDQTVLFYACREGKIIHYLGKLKTVELLLEKGLDLKE